MDSVKEWKSLIALGEQYKNDYADARMWNVYYSYYKNKFEEGILPINLVYSLGRSIIPQVYFSNPGVSVTSTIKGYDAYTDVLETLINRLFNKQRVKGIIKKIILHTFLYGTGIFKIGYGSYWGGTKENVAKRKYRMDYGHLDMDVPYLRYTNPHFFVIPYGTESMTEKAWECHIYTRPLQDAREDTSYLPARRRLKATASIGKDDFSSVFHPFSGNDERNEYVRVYEVHDFRDGKLKVFGEGLDEWLLYTDDITQEHGQTSIAVAFNEDPETAWGISDCTILYPQQKEINEIRTQNMKHRRIALIKFLITSGAIDDLELEKLLDGDVGPVVKVNGSLASSVTTFQPHIPPDFYVAQDGVREDVRELVGFSRNQIGEYDTSSRRTAYETMTVAQSAGIRIDERRDIIADAITQIAETFISYLTHYWNEYKVEQVMGVDGAMEWVKYNPSFLNKSYLVCKVDPDNQVPMTKMTRRRDALELINVLKGHPSVDQTALIKWIASFYDGLNLDAILGGEVKGSPENARDINAVNEEWQKVEGEKSIPTGTILELLNNR